jgi:Brp/Blh family beta-carotene 15,15'-monooxygenase
LSLALITVAVWFFCPAIALIGFLLLTAWHFGSGDAIWEKGNKNLWWLNSIGRGLIVIFSPIAFHKLLSGKVLIGLAGNAERSNVELIINASPYLVTFGIAAILIESILTANSTNSRTHLYRWTEIGLLLIMFWLTSPLLAVTFYLVGVHSWRHILRLEFYAKGIEKNAVETKVWQSVLNFHKRAMPMTALALIGLAGIFLFRQISLDDVFQMTHAYLILLSALTVPHAALIYWMETQNSSPIVSANI